MTLTDEDLTYETVLFNDVNDTGSNPRDTITGITDFAGEGVDQW